MRYCKFIFVIYVLLGSFLMVACSQDEDAKLVVNSNILKIGARTIRVCKEAAIAILDYYYITDSLEHDKNTNKIC